MRESVKTSPLVILGLDAAHPDFLLSWAKEGYLPTLASLLERGFWGKLTGPELICEHGIWVSLFSGISRRRHGYYYFRQLKSGTYDLQTVKGRDFGVLPFWAFLDGEKTAAVIDAPDWGPVPGLRGVQLADWATHDVAVRPSSYPANFLAEARQLFGREIKIEEDLDSQEGKNREIYRRLLVRIRKKGELCRHILGKGPFDLTVVVFSDSHPATHQFWKRNGPTHAIRDVYQAIDREMGRILASLPPNANVFLLSSTGMQDQYPCTGLIEDFCVKLKYQKRNTPSIFSPHPLDAARRIFPESWRVGLSRFLPREAREALLADQFRRGTDWKKTVAFAIPSAFMSFIRVNLKGREPEGVIEKGTEYHGLLDRLEEDLMKLVDPTTGKAAVKEVHRACKVFGKDASQELPDLFVDWQPHTRFMERVIHPRAVLTQKKPDFFRGTDHTQEGFLAAAGPSIQGRGDLGSVSLLDLAPTFLHFLDVSSNASKRLDGRVLWDMLAGS